MKTGLRITALLLVLIAVAQAGPDTIHVGGLAGLDLYQESESYPVLLALSGGGARGLASIGVLQALEVRGIRVGAVAGTSMGGIVGGLYSCGYSPEQLKAIVRSVDFNTFFANKPARLSMFLSQRQERDRHLLSVRFDGFRPEIPTGLTAAQSLTSMLITLTVRANYLANGDFLRLPIPFKTITTDIVSGRMEVMTSGSLADAMRATMAFPLAFTGLERDNQILMDGGMVAPIPVELVRQMSDTIRFVVAINTTSPLLPRERLLTPVDIAGQVTTIMTADQLSSQLASADYTITPPLDGITTTDFDQKEAILEAGYQAGLSAADSIIGLIKSRQRQTYYRIAAVAVESADHALADALKHALIGQSFTRQELTGRLRQLARSYGLFELAAISESATPAEGLRHAVVQDHELRLIPRGNLETARTTIEISGNTMFEDSVLVATMELPPSRITAQDLQIGLDRIVNQYHVEGYDLADIRATTIDFARSVITVDLNEAIIERIDVDGNRRTRDWLVRAYFPSPIGQPISTRATSQGLTQIYSTDLFERVGIVTSSGRSGAVVTINVEEKKYQQLRLGWHWDDEYQSEEFIELLDDNLYGIGMEYLAHLQYGRERQLYSGELKVNRIFRSYVTGRVALYHDRLDRAVFDAEESEVGIREEVVTGGSIRIGQHISRLGTVSGGLTFEELRLQDSRYESRECFGIRSLSLESLVENFDRWPFPVTGKKHLLELQVAGKYLGGDIEFTRFYSSLEAYFPLGKIVNYHPRLAIGLSRSGLPSTEQFYTGGMHAFAGYRTHQLSGDKLLLLNQEIRLSLPLRLYFTARYDVGETYAGVDQIKLRNLRHGFGMFLSADLPIGPVEFGYGVADEDHERWYFGAGLTF